MVSNLIYDVGMHSGEDTAYYLDKGYNVVAIDADPDLIAAARIRFAKDVEEARLTIVEAAVAKEEGVATFWICDEVKVLNSFDREQASKLGNPCRPIEVKTLPMRNLFQRHGVPYYLKVDIEGYDHVAVADIDISDRPKYVSMEVTSADDFFLLKEKGYTKFKCIQQGVFTQKLVETVSIRRAFSRFVRPFKSSPAINSLRNTLAKFRKPPASPTTSTGWSFSVCSTGPFGEDTPGEWQSMEEALHAWLDHHYKDVLGYKTWFDIHATVD
ncbi:FkbM family methyltransferase [Verrucomicrobium sp. BvORR106]|uniref:FkbM family methyltransferase n=1 Tax=Verrucomicrobium sp. BvORR106 TaxID=1403819 RepID=UPI00056E717F|nr:FkbM family methyltransferase [Verrucomicrobium sp. BvORR106]